MKRQIRKAAAASGALTFALAGAMSFGVHGASAATGTIPFSDPKAIGGATLENTGGAPITSGSLTDDPTFPLVVGNAPASRSTDNDATLVVATPQSGVTPDKWVADTLNNGAAYPAGTNPKSTGVAGALTLGEYIANEGENTDTSSDGYAGLYQLRLIPDTTGQGADNSYYQAVISVTETGSTTNPVDGAPETTGTWTLVSTVTNTVLSATPPATSTVGTPVTLTATVTPAAAGNVTFTNGATKLGTAATNAATGVATLTTTLPVGTAKIISSFVPTTPTSVDPSSSPTLNYTTVAAAVPPASLPEAPYALLLPLIGAAVGGVVVVRRKGASA